MAYTDAQGTNNSTRSNNLYSDLNLNFNKNPATKDIAKLKDVEAVKRSVRNLILTNRFERNLFKFAFILSKSNCEIFNLLAILS